MSRRTVSLPWFVGLRFGAAGKRSQLMGFISSISTAGLVLGVALLVLVVAVMNGFERELRTKILSVVPQVSLYHREGIRDWPKAIEEISALPAAKLAEAAAPFVQLEGLINQGKLVQPVLVYGIDDQLEPAVSHIEEFIGLATLKQLRDEPEAIVLGKALAEKLGLAVGDGLSLVVPKPNSAGRSAGVRWMTVIALLDTGTELDQSLGLMGLQAASELAPVPGTVSGIRLRLYDLFDASEVTSRLLNQLPYGYYGSNWMRTHGNLYQAVKMSSSLVWLLLVLIIGIAVFNVVSTLVLAVVEKQSNIAILRTLGASPAEILGVFMVQGLMIGVVGTLVGVAVGLLLTQVAGQVVNGVEWLVGSKLLTSEIYPVSYLPIDNRWQDVISIALTAIVLSLLASLYPAWRASRLQPADALRYD
ncbi:lipoprotein-releasing ABC transporter permease subunit [Halioxenophilus sp. WMMB6]|uniref:lipoprotein-releasing ABC transporter permease subunit n=1 Tax=Halioxenophilus sp. WMMB6 TaxID=3073815 RepID=UPI00295EC41F|nr:lipoprotein-releasing ABC transporter permease subunit [Halioxenophilus sp. WMMB6]